MAQQHISGAIDVFDADGSSNVFAGGAFVRDPRNADGPPAQGTDDTHLGFFSPWEVLNVVPAALATNNIALAQAGVADTALTLTAGTGVTLSGGRYYLDGVPATNASTDLAKILARNVRITSAGDDSAGTALVVGFDCYGVAMSELLTLTNASVVSGKKAFKSITSITPAGTLSGGNISAGTGDVMGFPVRADYWGDVTVFWNSALITASTGFVAAVTTTATTTTGDVRGTYAVQSASDATKRLQAYVTPKSYSSATVLFGVTQA